MEEIIRVLKENQYECMLSQGLEDETFVCV